MVDRFDVIIIGSGAGGGTLAHRLGQSGKRDPPSSSAVTACLSGAGQLGARRVFVDGNRYHPADTWYDAVTASPSSPRCTTSSAAPPSSTAPPCTGCATRTSASFSLHWLFARPVRIASRYAGR